jgi:hypothetical protein
MIGLLVALMLLAACGPSSNGKTPTANDRTQAVRFAQCIRDNGVPNFPDPDSSGRFNEGNHNPSDPALRAALEKCRDLAPGGEHEKFGDPAFVAQALQYAKCMRDNGVSDFPDPDSEGRFRGVGHEQQGNPTFDAAAQKCRDKLPGGGHQR